MSSPTTARPVKRRLKFEESFADFSIRRGRVVLTEGSSTAGFDAGTNAYDDYVKRLIQADQPIYIELTWETAGLMCPFIAGEWRAEVYLEKMGKQEYTGADITGKAKYDPNLRDHKIQINLPANSVPAGTYQVVVCLSLVAADSEGTHGPLAAFANLGIIKVYEESTASVN